MKFYKGDKQYKTGIIKILVSTVLEISISKNIRITQISVQFFKKICCKKKHGDFLCFSSFYNGFMEGS